MTDSYSIVCHSQQQAAAGDDDGSTPVLLRAKTAPPRAEHEEPGVFEGDEGDEETPALVRAMSCLSGKFLLDGRTLQLPSLAAIGMGASLAQRVEALREFLEDELGDMPFIRCVRLVFQHSLPWRAMKRRLRWLSIWD